jgi:hypothetical protein
VISFAAVRTSKGIEYTTESRDGSWTLVLRPGAPAAARYYLNGKSISPAASGIRLTGNRNHILVVQ